MGGSPKGCSNKAVNTPPLNETKIEFLPGGANFIYIRRIVIQQEIWPKECPNEKEVNEFLRENENRPLTINDIQGISDSIIKIMGNDKCKGYVPRQSFDHGVMYINVVPAGDSP